MLRTIYFVAAAHYLMLCSIYVCIHVYIILYYMDTRCDHHRGLTNASCHAPPTAQIYASTPTRFFYILIHFLTRAHFLTNLSDAVEQPCQCHGNTISRPLKNCLCPFYNSDGLVGTLLVIGSLAPSIASAGQGAAKGFL